MKKKLTAMLLALCMLLATLPALGEDASGTWYYVVADVNIGVFELREDGTADATVNGETVLTGTWTTAGTFVTISIEGDTITLAYDGSTLTAEGFPMTLYREAGKVDFDTILLMNDPRFVTPEGMTAAELEGIAKAFNEEMEKLGLSMEPPAERPETAAESETAELEVLSENFFVVKGYHDDYRAVYFAKVRNNNRFPVYISNGSMQVLNTEGVQVGEAKYLLPSGSAYLDAGEVSFIHLTADIPEDVEVTYTRQFEVQPKYIYARDIAIPTSDDGFTTGQTWPGENAMWVTVTNTTKDPVPDIHVVFALEDDNGTIWDIEYTTLYNGSLCSGSSIIMKTQADNDVMEYCKEHGIKLTTMEASAWASVR